MLTRFTNLIHYCCLVFCFAKSGKASDLGFWRRLSLGLRAVRVFFEIRKDTATSFPEQLVLLDSILNIDKSVSGHIAEFGCYKGASSVILSIGAKISGRKLLVFDSFEGLPEPTEPIRNMASGAALNYRKGMYAGSLSLVRQNIERHGEITAVEFVQGLFSSTLPTRQPDEKYAMIFEDADLVSSVKDVLKFAWPKLNCGAPFFCHEARDLEVCEIFFDSDFWKVNFACPPPGLVGAGMGLPLSINGFDDMRVNPMTRRFGSCLAYVFKPN
jgi:O-methyltransferase